MVMTERTDPALFFDSIPQELRNRDQWVCWKLEERMGKLTKVPYSARSGYAASSTNPNTWATFDEAVAHFRAHRSRLNGIGFVLTDADPYVGVDLDHCIDTETAQIEPWALDVLWGLHSYTEITPSTTGLRVFVRGSLPAGGRKKGNFEVYSSGRFLTVTGWAVRCAGHGDYCLTDNCGPDALPLIEERTEELALIHVDVFGLPELPPTPRPANAAFIAYDDQELIERAMNATNGERFRALWLGNRTGYASDSESDQALCSHLVFWCNGDTQRAGELFRQSGLFRPKWDERHAGDGRTYGHMTLAKALQGLAAVAPAGAGEAGLPRGAFFGGVPL